MVKASCVYWDILTNTWSSNETYTDRTTQNGTVYVTCRANHMTVFGMLLVSTMNIIGFYKKNLDFLPSQRFRGLLNQLALVGESGLGCSIDPRSFR